MSDVRPAFTLVGTGQCVKGIQHSLDEGSPAVVRIGRAADCELSIRQTPNGTGGDFVHLSRYQCIIKFEDSTNAWMLHDTDSTNGTAVKSGASGDLVEIAKTNERQLCLGDLIVLAGCDHFNFIVRPVTVRGSAPGAEEKTFQVLKSDEPSMQLIDQGSNRGIFQLNSGSRISLVAGTESLCVGEKLGTGASCIIRANVAPSHLGAILVKGEIISAEWHSRMQILQNQIVPASDIILTDGDFLTFPDAPEVSLLFHLPHSRRGTSFSSLILNDSELLIGRDATATRHFPHPTVSRLHARVWRHEGKWMVADLNSENGTFVNDQKITAPISLHPGDALRTGYLEWQVDDEAFCQTRRNGESVQIDILCKNICFRVWDTEKEIEKTILHPTSLRFSRNELVAIVGPSGCGKSTLLNVLAGQSRPTSGELVINGKRQHGDNLESFWRRFFGGFDFSDVSYVRQSDGVFKNRTLLELLLERGIQRGLSHGAARDCADQVLERCQIVQLQDRIIQDDHQLHVSGGQLKRVCVALALMRKANTLLLDEPTSPLDPGTKTSLMQLFHALAQQDGVTTILTTHDVDYVSLCHKVAVQALGRLVYYGPPGALLHYFRIPSAKHLYERLPQNSALTEDAERAEELEEDFRGHDFYDRYCRVME